MMKPDKQVYFERTWTPATFLSQKGELITVNLALHKLDITVPYTQVRDLNARCRQCQVFITRNSYQSHEGTSYCVGCYQGLDETDLRLMFGGPQWLSWEGQIHVRNMEDSHIINTISMLKRNAENAAELCGGETKEYLHPGFQHLVAELHRRRPPKEQQQANSFLLYLWSVFFMMFGLQKQEETAV